MPIQALEETPSESRTARSWREIEPTLESAKKDVKSRSPRYVSRDKGARSSRAAGGRTSVKRLFPFARSGLTKELLDQGLTE